MLLLLLLPCVILLYGCYLCIVARGYRHLPGNIGRGFPFFGNIYQSLRFSFLSQDEILSRVAKPLADEGGVYCTWLYCLPAVIVSNPQIAEKLVIHPAISNKDPLVYENVPNLWKGPFTMALADEKWKMRRKELTVTLSQPKLDKYHRTFVEASRKMVNMIKEEKEVFDILKHVQLTTSDIIVETHFGCNVNKDDEYELLKAFRWGEGLLFKSFLNPLFGIWLNMAVLISFPSKYVRPIRKLADMCIDKAISIIKENQIIEGNRDMLYSEIIMKRNLAMNKSRKEMMVEVMDLILVGSHTTTYSAVSVLYFLAALPEIQEKAWQEQREIFDETDRDPTVDDIKRMEYLDRVIKETLRFVSSSILLRKTENEINIDGIIFPSNTMILLCSRMMRMDERFLENPTKFDPDRYLMKGPYQNFKQAFSPFGFGTRNCPGGQYAINQAKVIVSMVLRHFQMFTNKKFEDIKLTSEIMMTAEDYNISVIERATSYEGLKK